MIDDLAVVAYVMKHYRQSGAILGEIRKSRNILINVHRNPDLDSVGSATALYQILKLLGKRADMLCPQILPDAFSFLRHSEKITVTDFSGYDYSGKDLFVILDSSSYDRVTGSKNIRLPGGLKKIVIDHHRTHSFSGKHNIVDANASATCEILYKLIADWGFSVDADTATALFSGIAGDTVFFKYARSAETFAIIADLVKKGAEREKIVRNIYNNNDIGFVRLLGKFLEKMEFVQLHGAQYGFVWAAIPYKMYEQYGEFSGVRETVADMFFRSVRGTGFGIAMLEDAPGQLMVSFRSKDDVDVSAFAKKLGGGGHKNAAGCTIYGTFSDSVRKVLRAVSA